MVDFNKWCCRNCKHYHTFFSGLGKPIDICANANVVKTHESYGCKCIKWESMDNLVYLEMRSKNV